MFLKNAADIALDCTEYLPFVESEFSYKDGDKFSSWKKFVLLTESFVGKQLIHTKNSTIITDNVSDNIRKLFSDYCQNHSRNYFEFRPTIPREEFLSAGWTEKTYQEYCNLTNNLYLCLMLYQNQMAPPEIWLTNQNRSMLKNKTQENLSKNLEVFCDFIKKNLHIVLKKTKEYNYIFGVWSGIFWCQPYEGRYDGETDPVKNLVFFATYDQFLSWVEYEIGDQILNLPPESSDSAIKVEMHKPPVDAPWYKLPYWELYEYRIHTTRPARENSQIELLSFDDFTSPDSEEKLQRVAFEFMDAETLDENVTERLEEYEYCDFDAEGDVLYIYKGETKCFREHHNIEPVTAKVFARRGNVVDININCCCDCHKYFISESEFFHYRDLYGIVCGLKVDRHSTGYARFPMAEYSVLRLYGYNVGKEDNLSDEERQSLLKILVEHDYVKKPEIIKYLEMFIKMNRGRLEMADSVSKWQADLAYVRELGLENQPQVLLEKIQYAR